MLGRDRIPNSRQHVGNRISHSLTPFSIANCRLPIENQLEIGNRKSAMSLPTRLHDAGDLSGQRQFTKADAAQVKLAQVAARATASPATCVRARRKLRLAISFRD